MIQPANSGYITFQNTTTFTFPHVETVIPQTTPTVLAKAYENYRFVTWKTVNNILLPSPDSASMYFVSSGNDTLLAIFEPIPEIPQTTYFPLSFTPNNDGLNDFFQVFHSETVTEGSIKIFDRWGEIIFQSNDINFKWDGTMNGRKIPDGVYFYQFNYLVKGKRYETISNRLTIIR
jgi:gliding motility-associated-like protein